MAFTGYSNSGSTYQIGSEKGMNFINDAVAGSKMTGGDGSSWTKNSDGSTTITKNGETWTVGSALSSLQNALDSVTRSSASTSAKSNAYAQEARDWSANQAAIANSFNASEAAKNRDWQEYMSNTAHQREIADLKAAGLNPVLSAMNGNGAAVTSGATANALMPQTEMGQADSSTQAIVSLLASMLAAQTSLTNTAVSAKTSEAIADKYTAMSEITSNIAAMASMANAATAAEASKYGTDMQYKIRQDFPDSMLQVIDAILSGSDTSYGSIGSMLTGGSLLDKIKSALGIGRSGEFGTRGGFGGTK